MQMRLIIQISRSHNIFYIFWTNAPTKSMLIQITQQLLSIDLAGSHIRPSGPFVQILQRN